MIPFTVKYAPKSLKEIVGNKDAVAAVAIFINSFPKIKKRAILLHGPPGSGKTSMAYALSREKGYEIIEVNASDFRDEKRLNASVGNASRQRSLFGSSSKIILVDEVDGLYSREDRGAVPTLVKTIKETAYPLILTANNPWDKKFSALRTACQMVELKQHSYDTVFSILRRICENEKINYEEKALSSLARRAGGDIRGALVDLQTLSGEAEITMHSIEMISPRKQTESIFNAIMRIFKTTDAFVARTSFDDVEEDLNEIKLWIDENLPKEYTRPADLCRAYEKLSRADVFNGRIRRRQHWHFLATISVLLSAGIALSKDEKYSRFVSYSRTQRILKIWQANQKNAKRKAIAEKICRKTHTSIRTAQHETLPYVKQMFGNNTASEDLTKYFGFDEEEARWLKKV